MFFGRVVRFFPPVVTGTVIAVIGLTLLPVAFGWAAGGGEGSAKGGSMANIGLAGATLLIILVLSRVGKPAISRLSILLGIVLGTALAAALGKAHFTGVTKGAMFALPEPLSFGAPQFDAAAVISMVVVVVVVLTETTADIIAVGEIVLRHQRRQRDRRTPQPVVQRDPLEPRGRLRVRRLPGEGRHPGGGVTLRAPTTRTARTAADRVTRPDRPHEPPRHVSGQSPP